jgi:hypothetical protein
MKKFLLVILIIISATVNGCNNSSDDNSNKNDPIPDQHVSPDFLDSQSFVNINHIDNNKSRNTNVNLIFNQDELKRLQLNTEIVIVPTIIVGQDKITISPAEIHTSIQDLKKSQISFQLTPIGNINGGNINITFTINSIHQNSKLGFLLSHRQITALIPNSQLYKIGTAGTAKLTAHSDAINDHFTVSFIGDNIDINSLTPSCELTDFSKDGNAECGNINFKTIADNVAITAIIEDEMRTPYRQKINVCKGDKDSLYFYADAEQVISFTQDSTVTILRCTNDLQPLTATINFSSLSLNSPSHIKLHSIADIIGVKDSPDNTFSFQENSIATKVIITRKNPQISLDDFRYSLPAKFYIKSVAKNYMAAEALQMTNSDADTPKITLQGDMTLDQGSKLDLPFDRNNIEDNTKIQFCLAKTLDSKYCDTSLDNQYSLTEINPGILRLDITGADKLTDGHYFMLAFLMNDNKQQVHFIGKHTGEVIVRKVPEPNFDIMPHIKHVLSNFPSFYYLGIKNDPNTTDLVVGDKLYLYIVDNIEACKGITINTVDNSKPNEKGEECTIGSPSNLGSCICPLVKGKLESTCIFRITLPNDFDNKLCEFSVRTATNFNLGTSMSQSVDGLPVIKFQVNSNPFSGNMLEMYGRNGASTSSTNSLNIDWISNINAVNIENNSIFNDDLLFEMKPEYFTFNQNTVTVNNYPGRNAINSTVTLPNIYFIAGWDNWNANDRCSGYDDEDMPGALGCNVGGYSIYQGKAYIPAQSIQVDSTGITKADGAIEVSPGWINPGNKNLMRLDRHDIAKSDASTVTINLHVADN